MSHFSNLASKALVVSTVGLLLPTSAEADEPVTSFVAGAAIVFSAAAVSAAATVAVASIVAIGTTLAVGDGGENTGENGGTSVPATGDGDGGDGGGENRRTVGEPELPEFARAYMDRDVTVGALQLTQAKKGGDATARAAANYRFHGNIEKAETGTRIFNLKDSLSFRFDVPAGLGPEDMALTFQIEELRLSTTDVAGTNGFSRIEFTAVQDGTTLWRWAARVDQGKQPRLEGTVPIPDSAVRRERDLLVIRGVKIPTEFRAPAGDDPTQVEFIMRVEGQGQRL